VRFLEGALTWFAAHGVTAARLMTEHGSAFGSKRFAAAIEAHRLNHTRTRPDTPRSNGKAERFIQTSLRDWACASPFRNSAARALAMPASLCRYNSSRPHSALAGKPPINRLPRNNLLGSNS
jgi:transposase InsO family protein